MTQGMSVEDYKRLAELEAAATPGPWAVDEDEDAEEITLGAGTYLANPGCYTSTDVIAQHDLVDDPDDPPENQHDDNQRRRDLEFIAAARNHMPELLARIENQHIRLEVAYEVIDALENLKSRFENLDDIELLDRKSVIAYLDLALQGEV